MHDMERLTQGSGVVASETGSPGDRTSAVADRRPFIFDPAMRPRRQLESGVLLSSSRDKESEFT